MKTKFIPPVLLYVSTLNLSGKQKPILYTTDDDIARKAYFAFELEAVSNLSAKYFSKWTTDILQILNHNDNQTTLFQIMHLHPTDNLVHVYFLFEIKANNHEELQKKFQELLFHYQLYFIDRSYYQPAQQPVYFRSITDPEQIENILKLIDFEQYKNSYHIHRPVKSFAPPNNIKGYGNHTETLPPIEIPAFTGATHRNFDLFFHLLAHAALPRNTLVQKIQKTFAMPEQLQALTYISNHKDLQNPFAKPYFTNINSLLENQNNWFEINTFLLSNQDNPTNLLNEISEIFFHDRAVFSQYETSRKQSDFTDIYDYTTAEGTFIIPVISRENIYANYRLLLKGEMHISPLFFNNSGILIGEHMFGKVYLDEKQFKKHTYIIGKTGTGKTSIIYSMLMDRIQKGKGVALIDPHGDLFEVIKKNIPPERQNDVIIFNPSDTNNNFGFSILEYDKNFPEQQSFIVNELLKLFSDIYDMKIAGGPMFETYFKMTAYLVMNTVENPILQDIDKVFRNSRFRTNLLHKCKTNRILDFFDNALRTSGDNRFENFGPYITSKLTRFTDNYYLAPVFNSREKSFDFRAMIDNNKIFLTKLDKGKLGTESVNFTGNVLFNRMIMAAYSRSNQTERERKSFSLFIDEFQNFTSDDIVTALAETRKYNLQLILANQNLAQIENKTARNILSNVGSIIAAAVAPYDAKFLEDFYLPEYQSNDLILLDNYKFIVKTHYNNKNIKPFILETIPY